MNAQQIIAEVVNVLKPINGVKAVVLGGSRARGTHHPKSDIDIGIYYDADEPLDISSLQQAAASLDDARREHLVTEIGGWGPWINGGGWLHVHGTPVDLLYRDLTRVSTVMKQCLSGEITIDYQPGHPHGFINAMYFSEVALCTVVWDPADLVGAMKSKTHPYPPVLRKALVNKFWWEATFALENGRKGVYKQDTSYIAGCCFRSIACLNQVLFALNESYFLNEKGAAAIIDSFGKAPDQYRSRVDHIITLIKNDPNRLMQSLDGLEALIHETKKLLSNEGFLSS